MTELNQPRKMWADDNCNPTSDKRGEVSKGGECESMLQTIDNVWEPSQARKLGPYFHDGRRRIDYVLTYTVQKPVSMSPTSSGSFVRGLRQSLSRSLRRSTSSAQDDPENASELGCQEDVKRVRREEFEDNLMEMGLELEKDEGTKIPGVGFLKIHAPWDILCREAEFMKLKMPTKKVYEVKSASNFMEKISQFFNKMTKPLQPNVEDSKMETIKHLSYPFSREKQHLFDLSDKDSFFNSKNRSLIVHGVLKRTKCVRGKHNVGLISLLGNGVYTSAYPLHDGDVEGINAEPNDRKLLYDEWARYSIFYKYQPIGLIRKYFGEKVGLYFAWLGVYTQMLIPASIVGVIVFLYGCATLDDNIPSMEICDPRNNITMCPLCDRVCNYWKLVAACGTARASHLFDNSATVFFSIFMALWATMFMEHWKRRQMRLNYIWDLTTFEEEEWKWKEHPRAEYEFRTMQKSVRVDSRRERRGKPKKKTVKLTCTDRMPAYMTTLVMMCFMICATFVVVLGVVLYRIAIMTALQLTQTPATNVRATVKTTAAIINLIIIIILDEVYGALARWLTVLEVPKTDKSFEERLIIKSFILKFLNSFTPIVYLAFFRGRLVGRPGSYIYVLSSFRMEECAHAGCLMELCIQLCITMLGKQLIQNNLFEIGIPKLKKMLRRRKTGMDTQEEELEKKLRRHEKDHFLGPFIGLSPEYMEMIMQFGMVTLFVASFPLAPLFALLNNVIEIRLDAKKFVKELRRPLAARAKNIGIWYTLLRGISKVAVIVNAFVISFTSDFIPRLVYQYMYSPDGTLHGFVDHQLSFFNVSHFRPGTEPLEPMLGNQKVEVCRYKDYRDSPWSDTPYDFSREFWCILAARLAFVIVFQNVVMLMSDFVDWLIPDIPKEINVQMQKERTLFVEMFMKEEQGKRILWNNQGESPCQPRSRRISNNI
ncbi:anoctamin-1a isoform X1 [Denticeps clupeoides]|uniref:Anoctamin n=1 Tax=Denticeps clupeoides TaxID=299321 RepID=A0AAY4EJF9_9TELE|nr:anoctamin-1 isoform X1 [Denticeps clupeoides]XP_028811575.1 anoctamin-1 isoform X1 [Denticeps clupeoides]